MILKESEIGTALDSIALLLRKAYFSPRGCVFPLSGRLRHYVVLQYLLETNLLYKVRTANMLMLKKFKIELLRTGFEPVTYGCLISCPTTVHRSTN